MSAPVFIANRQCVKAQTYPTMAQPFVYLPRLDAKCKVKRGPPGHVTRFLPAPFPGLVSLLGRQDGRCQVRREQNASAQMADILCLRRGALMCVCVRSLCERDQVMRAGASACHHLEALNQTSEEFRASLNLDERQTIEKGFVFIYMNG